ncbi:MAG: ester cyclase [Anaerolineae bacterium]|nr:ester cyclase [Anaerolineales bacterium]MCQ3978459.1 ester cyclase [Anaerolineae bacterium]
MSDQNKAIARRFFELFSQGDLETIGRELLSPEFVAHFPGMPGPLNPESYRQVGLMFRSAFPDIQDTVENQIADGDKVATRITSRGTHQGELMGIPATGKRYTITATVVDRIASGRIVERWAEFDQLGMLQQLGVIPAPGQ